MRKSRLKANRFRFCDHLSEIIRGKSTIKLRLFGHQRGWLLVTLWMNLRLAFLLRRFDIWFGFLRFGHIILWLWLFLWILRWRLALRWDWPLRFDSPLSLGFWRRLSRRSYGSCREGFEGILWLGFWFGGWLQVGTIYRLSRRLVASRVRGLSWVVLHILRLDFEFWGWLRFRFFAWVWKYLPSNNNLVAGGIRNKSIFIRLRPLS